MFLPEIFNLGTAFKQYFEIVPAYTDALKDDVYHIRHQVYCEELAYEPQRPNRREFDEYDAHSLHLLIRSVKTGEFVGCTRIVRARESDPNHLLPFEKTCSSTLDRSIVDEVVQVTPFGEDGRVRPLLVNQPFFLKLQVGVDLAGERRQLAAR